MRRKHPAATGVSGLATAAVVAALFSGASALPGSDPLPVGPQFQVNAYTSSNQFVPAIVARASGDFVVVWQSYGSSGGDSSHNSIQGQRMTSSGAPLGSQFQVNSYTTLAQSGPAVAADRDGRFVVVWHSNGSTGDASGYSVLGQRYASSGTPAGGEFLVPSYTTNSQLFPAIAAGADGDFVAVWDSFGSGAGDSSLQSIQGQRFSGGGTSSGGEFQVNAYTTDAQRFAAIAAGANGDFVVAWQSNGSSGGDTSGESIQGQRYAASGAPSGVAFQVNSYTPNEQAFPALAVGASGDFVAIWKSLGSSGSDSSLDSIQGQRFTATGAPAGSQFQVNGYTPNAQGFPAVALDADGEFVVVWDSDGSSGTDTSGFSIQGQRYSANGLPAGSPFQVNSFTMGAQRVPTVATQADGDFVVVWQSNGSSGSDVSGYSIQGQRFRVTGDLQGTVFFDEDFDGIQDAAEPGIAGIAVELYDDQGIQRRSTLTDTNGDYFLTPKEGSWHARFVAPFEYSFTLLDAGADDTADSDAHPANGETAPFDVSIGVLDASVDAGLTNGVGDKVWNDLDHDGIRDGGEPGLAGVTVRLRDKSGSELQSTLSDAAGFYHFNGIAPGFRFVEFDPPPGFAFSPPHQGSDDDADSDADPSTGASPVFTFELAEIDTSIDAGLYQLSSIGGRAWDDLDRDGLREGGEPGIDGILVRLLDAGDAVLASQGTTGGGFYAFEDLVSATYRLEVVPLGGLDLSPQNAGGDDSVDSDFDPSTARTAPIVFTAGSVVANVDAGLRVVVLLVDDFESNDFTRWSAVVP